MFISKNTTDFMLHTLISLYLLQQGGSNPAICYIMSVIISILLVNSYIDDEEKKALGSAIGGILSLILALYYDNIISEVAKLANHYFSNIDYVYQIVDESGFYFNSQQSSNAREFNHSMMEVTENLSSAPISKLPVIAFSILFNLTSYLISQVINTRYR